MINLKETLWGTQEEVEADKKYNEYLSQERLSSAKKAEIKRLKGLSKRLLFRRGATSLVIAGVAMSPLAYYILHEDEQSQAKYNGPLISFQDLEYVSNNSLLQMLEAMKKTSHPILNKVALGVQTLYESKNRPSEFPDWIDENSFPLKIVQDQNNDTSITQFQALQTSNNEMKFSIPSVGATEPQEAIDKMMVGIKLGLKITPLSGDLLLPALLLTKEYLTLLHGISLNEEYYDLVKKAFPNTPILDISHKEIIDRSKQKAVGRKLLMNNISNDQDIAWKILDGFSMLIAGTILKDLVVSGKLVNYKGMDSLIYASNIVNDSKELQTDLENFTKSWCLGNNLLFPVGTGEKSTGKLYTDAVIKLENQISQSEKK